MHIAEVFLALVFKHLIEIQYEQELAVDEQMPDLS